MSMPIQYFTTLTLQGSCYIHYPGVKTCSAQYFPCVDMKPQDLFFVCVCVMKLKGPAQRVGTVRLGLVSRPRVDLDQQQTD